MEHFEILDALDNRLDALTDHWPIAWFNTPFVPSENKTGNMIRYYRVRFVVTSDEIVTHDGDGVIRGLYSVNVIVPENIGQEMGLTEAGRIAAHFPFNLQLPTASGMCSVNGKPNVAGALDGDTNVTFPVVIPWIFEN